MSEVGPAPQPGADEVPVRPPSKPSRLPLFIWIGIAVFCLVTLSAALALFVWSRKAFSSEDLKQATSIKIVYVLRGNRTEEVVVDDPADLKSLLDALVISEAEMAPVFQPNLAGTVVFTLPGGKVAETTFGSRTQLNRTNWGYVIVSPDFYHKVNEIARRAKGRPIDIMKLDN